MEYLSEAGNGRRRGPAVPPLCVWESAVTEDLYRRELLGYFRGGG